MNRRQFLRFAAVPIAAAVVIPELVRTIILPPRGGWPVDYVERYTHVSYALGYTITAETDEDLTDYTMIRPVPFREPSPQLFALLREMERARRVQLVDLT